MRVLITGAGGHIGSAVVSELIAAGHEVTGLVRSDASAHVVAELGARAHRGDVRDRRTATDAARDADAVVHLAFDNAAAVSGRLGEAAEADLAVVEAFGDALAGSEKAFVGIGLGATGDPEIDAMTSQNPRFAVSNAVLALADRDVRAVLVSVPPVVHSTRDEIGFVPTLIGIARATGRSGYIGEGDNRWPAVHTRDLGVLFRLAVERASKGTQLLGAAEDDVTTRAIAETIARQLDLPAERVPAEAAEEHFGLFAQVMTLDFPPMAAGEQSAALGWRPSHPGLIADLEDGHYFARA